MQNQIKLFDLVNMRKMPHILLIGRNGSGTSFLTKDLLFNLNIGCGMLISPEEKMYNKYDDVFPDLYIHNEYSDELLDGIIKAKRDENAVVVMEGHLDKKHREVFSNILMNGRHYKLSMIVTMQDSFRLEPALKMNFDYIFLFGDNSINRKKMWKNYAGMFSTFADFERVFLKCTSNYSVMVIDNTKMFDGINGIFRYRASEQSFTFGSDDFIQVHNKYYRNMPTLENHQNDPLFEKYKCFINMNKLISSGLNDNFRCMISDNDISSDNELLSDNEDNVLFDKFNYCESKSKEFVNLSYKDNKFEISARINPSRDNHMVEILCNHIQCMRAYHK